MLKRSFYLSQRSGFLTACATAGYPTNVPLSEASSVFGAMVHWRRQRGTESTRTICGSTFSSIQ